MRITVVDMRGAPVPNARVVMGTTDVPTGELTGVAYLRRPDGTYPFRVTATGLRPVDGSVTVAGAAVTARVELFEDRTVTVRVRGLGANNTWWLGSYSVVVGNFPVSWVVFENIPVGRYQLRYEKPGNTFKQPPNEVLITANTDLTPTVANIGGYDAQSQFIDGSMVTCAGFTDGPTMSLLLLPGEYPYTITAPGFRPAAGVVRVPDDVNHFVQLYRDVDFTATFQMVPAVAGGLVTLGSYSAITDDAGRASITAPSGAYTLAFDVPLFEAPAPSDYAHVADNERMIYLLPGAVDVVFHLTDSTGPARGVTVRLNDGHAAVSDASGNATMRVRYGQTPYTYSIRNDGYQPVDGQVLVGEMGARVDVPLTIVRYPVTFLLAQMYWGVIGPGARITAGPESAVAQSIYTPVPLRPGTYAWRVEMECFEAATGSVTVTNRAVEVSVVLPPSTVPMVLELKDRQGNPAAGVEVTLFSNSDVPVDTVTTGADGLASFRGPAGNYRFGTTLGPYLPSRGYITSQCGGQTRFPVTLAPSTPWPLVIHIVDTNERPLAGISVATDQGTVTSDANGDARFLLREGTYSFNFTHPNVFGGFFTYGVPEGGATYTHHLAVKWEAVTFQVSNPPRPLTRLVVESDTASTQGAGPSSVQLQMQRGMHTWRAHLFDHFNDASGSIDVNGPGIVVQVPAVETVYPVALHVEDLVRRTPIAGVPITLRGTTVTTDATGLATFMLPFAAYSVALAKTGYLPATIALSPLAFGGSATLTMIPETYSLVVNLVDAGGPVPLAEVLVDGAGGVVSGGSATFGVYNGPHRIIASSPWHAPTTLDVTVPNATVTTTLTMPLASFPVTFRVLSATDDSALANATVTIGGQSYTTNANGEVVVMRSRGSHPFTVAAANHISTSSTLEMEPNAVLKIVRLAQIERRVTFTVTGSGNPQPDAEVQVANRVFPLNASGSVALDVVPGTYTWSVKPPRGFDAATGSVVVGNMDTSVNVTLMPSARYAATFNVTSSGAPLSGAVVTVDGQQVTSDASGNATAQLLPGTYDWLARKTGYQSAGGSITVVNAAQSVSAVLLPQAYVVTFVVSDPDPVVDASITAATTTVKTNASGNATIERVNGTYSATVTSEYHQQATTSFTVASANLSHPIALTPTPEGLARLYRQRNRTALDTMNALKTRLNVTAGDGITILLRYGFDTGLSARALRDAYALTNAAALSTMLANAVSAETVARVGFDALFASTSDVVQAFKAANVPAEDGARAMAPWVAQGYGFPNELSAAGYSAQEVLSVLVNVARQAHENAVPNLNATNRYSATEQAAAVRAVLGIDHLAAARLLRIGIASATTIAVALTSAYGLSVQGVVEALRAAGFDYAPIRPALQASHNATDAEYLAAVFAAGELLNNAVYRLVRNDMVPVASVTSSLRRAGVPIADTARVLFETNVALPAVIVDALAAAGDALSDVFIGMSTVVSYTELVVPVLNKGMNGGQLASILRDSMLLTAEQAESALRQGGYSETGTKRLFPALLVGGYTLGEILRPVRGESYIAQQAFALGETWQTTAALLEPAMGTRYRTSVHLVMLNAGYPLSDVLELLHDALQLDAQGAHGALSTRIVLGTLFGALQAEYGITATDEVRILKAYGSRHTDDASARDVATRFMLDAAGFVRVYRAAGASVFETATALSHAFGLTTPAQVIPVLRAAEWPFPEACLLFLPVTSVADLWKDAGYTAHDFGLYLNGSSRKDARTIVTGLNPYNFTLHELVVAMRALGYAAGETTDALGTSFPAQSVANEVTAVFMVDARIALLGYLRQNNYPARYAAQHLARLGLTDATGQLLALRDAGYDRPSAVPAVAALWRQRPNDERTAMILSALETAYGGQEFALLAEALRACDITWHRDVADVLVTLLYSATEAASVMDTQLGMTASETLHGLANAGYTASQWQSAVSTEFGTSPLQILATEAKDEGLVATNVVGRAQRLSVALGTPVQLATMLSTTGFTRTDVEGVIYYLFGLLPTMTVLRDVYGVGTAPAMVTALRADGYPSIMPETMVEALGSILGVTRVDAVTAMRGNGYSVDTLRDYLIQRSPRDTGLAGLMRSYGLTAAWCWRYLDRVRFTEAEGAGFMHAQGYALEDIVYERFTRREYLEGVNLAVSQGFLALPALRAVMAHDQRSGSSFMAAGLTTLGVARAVGLSKEAQFDVAMALSRSQAIPLFAQFAWEVRRQTNEAGWTLRDVAWLAFNPDGPYSARSLAQGIVRSGDAYSNVEKFDAVRFAMNRQPELRDFIGGLAGIETLLTFLANDGLPLPSSYLAAASVVGPLLGARTVMEVFARVGVSWKVAIILGINAGFSFGDATSAAIDIYKPIIIFELALNVVVPSGIGWTLLRLLTSQIATRLATEPVQN